jgi:hypothetical protein
MTNHSCLLFGPYLFMVEGKLQVVGSLGRFCLVCSFLHILACKGFHFFIVILTILFFPELPHLSFATMPTLITCVIQDGEPTMAPSIPASRTIPISASKLKKSVQRKINGEHAAPVPDPVIVPSFIKDNGTRVASYTRHASIFSKSKSAKKVSSHKKKKATKNHHFFAKFEAPDDCKESVSLAHSLRIEELQKLMKPHH